MPPIARASRAGPVTVTLTAAAAAAAAAVARTPATVAQATVSNDRGSRYCAMVVLALVNPIVLVWWSWLSCRDSIT